MAVFKCKMCGGTIEFEQGATVGVCEYCGTKQTLPSQNDEVQVNLFNRANNLRLRAEYDKAQEIYEKMATNGSTDPETFWGIVLCKYGIEYVEDPATQERIPTCHRTQMESVATDDDYLSALNYADANQKTVYEAEAKKIDAIQKGILAISKKEEPFDVFICYKESDENGKRTQDSVIANDIYYQLTQEGFKVFYAAITLEDKLGQEYEPYIFAALNSAKVMLVIGTKPEYFNAVWVKNEWSRYLKLANSSGGKKLLIPCYRDMDAYDLPEEFSHLQAQDMGKIGFINDITRGIKKVLESGAPKLAEKETAPAAAAPEAAPLLKRAFMFLEDGDWQRADDFCEQVLNIDPECAQAYLGKLMAELRCGKQEDLQNQPEPFDTRNNYQKALRFADEALKAELDTDTKMILYNIAARMMNSASNESQYRAAAEAFRKVPGFTDADAKVKECNEKAEIAQEKAETARKEKIYTTAAVVFDGEFHSEREYRSSAGQFRSISGYKDADAKAIECEEKAEAARKNRILTDGIDLQSKDTIEQLKKAISSFEVIPGWKDADDRKRACHTRIEEIIAEEERKAREAETARKDKILTDGIDFQNMDTIERLKKAISNFETIPDWKDADQRAAACRARIKEIEIETERKRREIELAAEEAYINEKRTERKTFALIFIAAATLVAIIGGCTLNATLLAPRKKYNAAVALRSDGDYDGAVAAFTDAGDYRDVWEQVKATYYAKGEALLTKGDFAGAVVAFENAEDYLDAAQKHIDLQLSEIRKASVGEMVLFGSYEQDNNTANGKEAIEWIILDKQNGKALLISKYALDCQRYKNTSWSGVTWETCSLRTWLNHDFLNSAFSEAEQEQIVTTSVSANKNPKYRGIDPGNATSDKVFLLSIVEAKKYFSTDEKRKTAPTEYAISHGAWTSDDYKIASGEATCRWWLRSPGRDRETAAYVKTSGSASYTGNSVDSRSIAIRPAIWVNLEEEK